MLNKQKIQELQEKLLAEKQRLEAQLGQFGEKEGDGDYIPDMSKLDLGRAEEDNASEVGQMTDNLGVTDTLTKRLEEVLAALERIEKGTYGKCQNCAGEEIPVARLEANPAAKTCMKCS